MKTDVIISSGMSENKGRLSALKDKMRMFGEFLYSYVPIVLAAYFSSSLVLPGGMMPFGVALYAASGEGTSIKGTIIAISAVLGTLNQGNAASFFSSLCAVLIIGVSNYILKDVKKDAEYFSALGAGLALGGSKLIFACFQGFAVNDMAVAVAEGILVFCATIIFRKGIKMLSGTRTEEKWGYENIIGLFAIIMISIGGFYDISLFSINLKNLIYIILVLLSSYIYGPGAGTILGVIAGITAGMNSQYGISVFIAAYSFSGLIAGLLKNAGRIAVVFGFVSGNILMQFFINNTLTPGAWIYEMLVGAVVFILIPSKYIKKMQSVLVINDTNDEEYSEKLKKIVHEKLQNFSKVFYDISNVFNNPSNNTIVGDKQDISILLDSVAEKVCIDCSSCIHCWDKNFYNTYDSLFKTVGKLEEKGFIEADDFPKYFIDKCGQTEELANTINNLYAIHKVNMAWKNKTSENKNLVSQQIQGISCAINGLAEELCDSLKFDKEIEKDIETTLNNKGFDVQQVSVALNRRDKFEINIKVTDKYKKNNKITDIEDIITGGTKRVMTADPDRCSVDRREGLYDLSFIEAETLSVCTAVASASKDKDGVSGDNYTYLTTRDRKFIIALSDGMGTGDAASIESKMALNLLRKLLEAGFDRAIAMKIMNSMLVLKSDRDNYATIDVSIVDLYNGEAEFVKCGATPAYIKRGEKGVETVRSFSLPAGIIEESETVAIKKKLYSGDFIIMMSDGVFDSFNNLPKGHATIKSVINSIDAVSPEIIADELLKKACENYGENREDDMMVMVSKVWKKVV